MSTRATAYYESGARGVHIYKDMAKEHDGLFLEYREGAFSVNIPLSRELSDLLLDALKEKLPEKRSYYDFVCGSGRVDD